MMLDQGAGHIVNVTTTLADQPLAAVPGARRAIEGRPQCGHPVARHRICEPGRAVNAVSPGTSTPMHASETRVPRGAASLRPHGEVDEVVDAVLYLDDAKFVTGGC
ncbi:MAG: hypothetical protein R3D01_01275 [Hyphomicrobiales bacterium]